MQLSIRGNFFLRGLHARSWITGASERVVSKRGRLHGHLNGEHDDSPYDLGYTPFSDKFMISIVLDDIDILVSLAPMFGIQPGRSFVCRSTPMAMQKVVQRSKTWVLACFGADS